MLGRIAAEGFLHLAELMPGGERRRRQADTILFALQAPDHVNVAELFVLPTDQPW